MHGTRKYKTAVTDYEGMQALLDTHAAQGWTLFSVAPDTWRRSIGGGEGMETPPFEALQGAGVQEYSASYYLLVFERDEGVGDDVSMASLEEALPGERLSFEM